MADQIETYLNPAQVSIYRFQDDGAIPNNPNLPLLVYHNALRLDGSNPAAVAEAVFAAHGWVGSWRNGIYPYHHYHSTAHEVLAICRGQVRVQVGGEQGQAFDLAAGDVVVIPAGIGHKNLGASADLLVVGAYPPGEHPDLCYGKPDERPRVLHNIADVPLPTTDPVYGNEGPLLEHWCL